MNYTELANTRYTKHVFIQSPSGPTVEVLYTHTYTDERPKLSIVTPIYNQEAIIEKNIQSVLTYTTGMTYELIYIVDACSDATDDRVVAFLKTTTIPALLTQVVVFRSVVPLFETAADNLGCLCSRGAYILELQADIELIEVGYNQQLLRAFDACADLIAVSGRCCHGLTYNEGCGKLGMAAHDEAYPLPDRNTLYSAETCNRGPLLLHKERLAAMGYFDEVHYFLDNSDHDLFTRARIQRGWLCGYVPIYFRSPLHDGSTRKPRDPVNEDAYQRKKSAGSQNGFLYQWLATRPASYPIRTIRLPTVNN
jgi:glycosyltransferase involved in cell wall biosynthesis